MKIRILGPSGSGKTTLAGRLAHEYQIPLFHGDDITHSDKFTQKRSEDEQKSIIQSILQDNHDRIIEGTTMGETFRPTILEADRIIYLQLPRYILWYRIIKRYFQGHPGQRLNDLGRLCVYAVRYESIQTKIAQMKKQFPDKIEYLYH